MVRKLSETEIFNIQATAAQMTEKQRRQFYYRKAQELGRGGVRYIARTFHVSGATLVKAGKELANNGEWKKGDGDRAKGAGKKKATEKFTTLRETVLKTIDPATYGIPTKVIRWTTMSQRKISAVLKDEYSIHVSPSVVRDILKEEGYSRQKNKKAEQVGEPDPDRNGQFMFIDSLSAEFLGAGDPVISVDTKKKENTGNFSNGGTEYRKRKDARRTPDHDFPVAELGKVVPYGVYCPNNNTGFVNLGTDHDTSEFAMASILLWWESIGRPTFPDTRRILITCDCGGGNRARGQMWKEQMVEFSEMTGLEVYVSHFPAGCSKWNKVEHRLFAYISKSWQGQPLIDIETTVSLIGSTTTTTGLKVECALDQNKYELNRRLHTKNEFDKLPIYPNGNMGKWNYIIDASKKQKA